jgi:Kef-type K+ transport system membrane component KefB
MDPLTRAIIDMCILLFSAKLIGVIFKKLGLPENIGFIFAGLLLGPSLFGSIRIGDFSLVELNDYIRVFAKLGAILLLFLVGLNISLIELKTNRTVFVILGFLGALSPLILGVIFYRLLEKNLISTIIVSSAIATSSLPIVSKLSRSILTSSRVKIASNITIVDNIIGVLILSTILPFLEIGEYITLQNAFLLILKTLVFSLALLIITIFLVPIIIKRIGAWGIYFGKQGGMIEVLITAMCFFYAALAYAVGLSPITGAIICGMAVAGSHILVRVKDYVEKISFLFAPIFFVIIGANIKFSSLSFSLIIIGVLLLSIILFSGNVIGSLIPAFFAFHNWRDAWVISLTRFSLGNVGLVIAGIGFNNSAISSNVYLQIVILAIISFILNPFLIKQTQLKRIRQLE